MGDALLALCGHGRVGAIKVERDELVCFLDAPPPATVLVSSEGGSNSHMRFHDLTRYSNSRWWLNGSADSWRSLCESASSQVASKLSETSLSSTKNVLAFGGSAIERRSASRLCEEVG